MSGTLYIVATPIGNIRDISLRALDVLNEVDLVACEDTRHTGKLLKHLEIKQKLISFHDHNESLRKDKIVELLQNGSSVALVSDAGTPCISDPGYKLVNAVRESGANVTIIPGPNAFVSAAVLSGLPTDALYFGGFLPSKTGSRKKALTALRELDATLVFYESPKRLAASLKDCLNVFGPRKAVVVREITKLYEETNAGTLDKLAEQYDQSPPKGEIVILIDRTAASNVSDSITPEIALIELVTKYENEGVDRKIALKRAAKECGLPKSEAYRIMMQHRND
jgi:16S rRNA (cytidine1402-2'-O)-methyltransferase